jgi:hypothetical protein
MTGSSVVAELGGLFALMTLAHFVYDWVPQREQDAVRKQYDWRVRFAHCFVYSALITITLAFIAGQSVFMSWMIFNWLFITHFVEDTYWLPLWWMKNIRKSAHGPYEGFNLVLVVVIDQTVHLACLLVACYLALL